MNEKEIDPASFEAFKKSFFYGSRSDMNFKFLAHLNDASVAEFIQGLFWMLGDAFNDGDFRRVVDHVFKWQQKGYENEARYTYETGPFFKPKKGVSRSKIVLITSSGHFVKGDDPEPLGVQNMDQETAFSRIFEFLKTEPQLSAIPLDTPKKDLMVRHGGYDVRAALADPNAVFPKDIILNLKKEGALGSLSDNAYSFVGACSQKRLLKQAAPRWVDMMKKAGVGAALLVPV